MHGEAGEILLDVQAHTMLVGNSTCTILSATCYSAQFPQQETSSYCLTTQKLVRFVFVV